MTNDDGSLTVVVHASGRDDEEVRISAALYVTTCDESPQPDEVQKELLRQTAVHIVSSLNPAQLEMRILENHNADKRFAFFGAVGCEHGTLLKTQLDSSPAKRNKPRNRKRSHRSGGCRFRDWLDMVTAMRVETSPLSRKPQVCQPFWNRRVENIRAAMVRKPGGRPDEKELENGLLDIVWTST